jgi:hypothetical protein
MQKQKLPNATAVLILGIASIVTCCCYGILGLILGIIALVLAKKDLALYAENPELYDNYSNLNTGKILAIIGIVLSALSILYYVWIFATLGFENLGDQQLMQEKIKDMMGQ